MSKTNPTRAELELKPVHVTTIGTVRVLAYHNGTINPARTSEPLGNRWLVRPGECLSLTLDGPFEQAAQRCGTGPLALFELGRAHETALRAVETTGQARVESEAP